MACIVMANVLCAPKRYIGVLLVMHRSVKAVVIEV